MIKEVGEELIQELLKIDSFKELEKELFEMYPDGFDVMTLDKRIINKLKELASKHDSIKKPVQKRKK